MQGKMLLHRSGVKRKSNKQMGANESDPARGPRRVTHEQQLKCANEPNGVCRNKGNDSQKTAPEGIEIGEVKTEHSEYKPSEGGMGAEDSDRQHKHSLDALLHALFQTENNRMYKSEWENGWEQEWE